MKVKKVVWTEPVLNKLRSFSSDYFTPDETYDYIIQVVLETENVLLNEVFSKAYVEEVGEYKGLSRIVISRFRIYFRILDDRIVVFAVLFPGEN